MKTLSNFFDNKRVFHSIKFALTCCLLVLSWQSTTVPCPASEKTEDAIFWQAEALVRTAALMKEEIKSGFRGAKGLGKTTSLLSQVGSRATTVSRRFQRRPDYPGLNRDLEKLVKLTRQLEVSYQELSSRAVQDRNAPVTETSMQVATQFVRMTKVADSMLAIATDKDRRTAAESTVITIPEYDPEVDFAPSASPAQAAREKIGVPPAGAKPRPAKLHSVLEK